LTASQSSVDDQGVLLRTQLTPSGQTIGFAELATPQSLNALNYSMVQALTRQLMAWQDDPQLALVVLTGAGEKAFCAGGDIRTLYYLLTEERQKLGQAAIVAKAKEYFAAEYRLDYLIHRYPRPVLCWGHGIVMGGGLGLMVGASQRVVTETSRLAMPEISIGLVPDVGASWFLNRLPKPWGLFLGLTGATVNASDALLLGLADRFISQHKQPAVFAALVEQRWSQNIEENQQKLFNLLKAFAQQEKSDDQPDSLVLKHQQQVQQLLDYSSLVEIVNAITAIQCDSWLATAATNLAKGCPVTAWLVYQQLTKARYLSLADCFRLELGLVMQCCCYHPDLVEGIRALLIDKDKQPKWRYASVQQVPAEYLAGHWSSSDSGFQQI
jgi:enoyl-CoA hydratase/carnithine racemase